MKYSELPDNKKEIFQVPDGYFEHLPGRVLQRIERQQTAQAPSTRKLYATPLRLAGMAAMLVLAAYLALWPRPQQSDSMPQTSAYVQVNSEDLLNGLTRAEVAEFMLSEEEITPDLLDLQGVLNEMPVTLLPEEEDLLLLDMADFF